MRRSALAFIPPLVLLLALAACGRKSPGGDEVVLYSSSDDGPLREVVRAFEAAHGIRVRTAGDTEATKTTGLVQRLLAEREAPRADVWWSNELMGTLRLGREGVFEPYTSAAEADFGGTWPDELRGEHGDWYGFAMRARVIVYSTRRVDAADIPRRLDDFTRERWKGRFGMARPQFGTTRGHIAALVALAGESETRRFLLALRENGLRLYDGNSAVVRAVANAEIDAGLTDTDDVYVGLREGWPVAMVFEEADGTATGPGFTSFGPVLIPSSVARVRGGPNPASAAKLIDFLLSEQVERILARDESRFIPIRPSVAADFPAHAPSSPARVPPSMLREAEPVAAALIEEVFPIR